MHENECSHGIASYKVHKYTYTYKIVATTTSYSTLLNPRSCANFKALCTGGKGVSETTGVKLSYTNTLINRVVPGLGG